MTMDFFSSITDIKELKREYIKLLKQWHPDNFSEQSAIEEAVQTTQEINSQYDRQLAYLKSHVHSEEYSEQQQKQDYYYWQYDNEFRRVINTLAACSWISNIELCGCFLWFQVDYKYKNKIKDLDIDFDIKYAPKKKLFFICLNRQYRKKTFKEMDMSHIRFMYGSEQFYSSKGSSDNTKKKKLLQTQ